MWNVQRLSDGEVTHTFESKADFDLQQNQLVTKDCVYRGVGLKNHIAVEVPDSPELIAYRTKTAKRAELLSALSDIDLRSIRALREGNVAVLSQLDNEAAVLREQLRGL